MGLAVLFVFIILRLINFKKFLVYDLAVFISCLLGSFVNPYGSRIWHEVWLQLSDTSGPNQGKKNYFLS